MSYDPSIFNINPYYDDYDSEKGFLRILFKPGYAVQAREMTQLQSILQNQVSKLGDHIFKDGSRVVGGGISVRSASYIRINPITGVDYSAFVGRPITQTSTGNQAKIVHYVLPEISDSVSDNYVVLILDFISGDSFAPGSSLDVSIVSGAQTITQTVTTPTSSQVNPVSGVCKLIGISDGIFYVDGFFVRMDQQYFVPYNYSGTLRDFSMTSLSVFDSLTKKVGFYVSRDNVSDQQDSTLRDPAIGSYNYNAPGADRYKINLTLGQTEATATPDDFVELLRFENGKITKKIDKVAYADIQKALAERTYDESGSYIVKPFELSVESSSVSENLNLKIGTGKAYVYGYQVENQNPFTIGVSAARDTTTESARNLNFSLGNWIGVSMGTPQVLLGETFGANLLTISSGAARVEFRNAANTIVGRAYVHGAVPMQQPITGNRDHWRLYLYGLSGDIGAGVTGYIYDFSTGYTLASFGPTGAASSGGFTCFGTDYSGLVYPLQPCYAGATISSMRVAGKFLSNRTTGNYLRVVEAVAGTPGSVTYQFNRSDFTDTIGTDTSITAYQFPSAFTDYSVYTQYTRKDIAIIGPTGSAYVPQSPDIKNVSGTVYLRVTDAPAGFTTGNLRVMCPVVYTPNTSNTSTFRTKTSTALATPILRDSYSALNTDESGRLYYQLDHIDVYSITAVVNNTDNTISYLDDFELDDGQRETHYQVSRLYVKKSKEQEPRYKSAALGGSPVSFRISYSYFVHGGYLSAPFIGKHSYINIPYEQIPLFTNSKTGKTVSLANCIDFRHSGLTASNPILKPYGVVEFGSNEPTLLSYQHYLPRIDKLCVKADPQDGSALFYVLNGMPDMTPTAPPDPQDGLVLAVLTVPAYTHSPESVVITPVENKRFTMSDIGKIDKRVDEVEVFTKLSVSELEIESRSLKPSNLPTDVEPLKTSIFSDEFYGHSIADIGDDSFACSIDYERGELRPYFSYNNYSVPTASEISGVTVSSDGLVTLSYTLTPHVTNTQYTKKIKINPSNTINWLGFMELSQPVNPFFDTGYRPIVKTNALMENDNWISANTSNMRGFGTQWNDWESIWTGIEQVEEEQDDIQKRMLELPRTASSSGVPSFLSGNNRIGVSRTVVSTNQKTSAYLNAKKMKNRIRYRIGSRVVDRSVVPFIPTATITATVDGLKPNTSNMSLYFDGKLIKTGISSGSTGSCAFTFGISAGQYLVGSKLVRLVDPTSTVSAEAMYHCTGILEQRDSGSYSTRPPELRRQSSISETISKDPFNRDIDTIDNTYWNDPLSQTFLVDKKTTPDGIFVKQVSLYFSAKDSTLPVTIQIRPTVGGYPSPSVCIPFSTTTLAASQVNANSSTPVATTFEFSSPVYLEPGEYSICILCNSNSYELYAADSAYNSMRDGSSPNGRAGNNQLVGTLFTPHSVGPLVAEATTDLMFTVDRCKFDGLAQQPQSGYIKWNTFSAATGVQIVKVYAPEIKPSTDTTITRTIGTTRFENNDSVHLPSVNSSAPALQYTLRRGIRNTVSPVIDLKAMYATGIKMYANSSSTSSSRYVSRVVELPEELLSNGIAVFLNANIPSGANIKVYYRISQNGESDIFTKVWKQFSDATDRITPTFTSNSDIDYREVGYRVSGVPKYKAYQIRVDLESTSLSPSYFQTPAVRNISTVSFVK